MIDAINTELQIIAEEEKQSLIEIQYEEFIDVMMAQYDLLMYACNSYDCDAEYYGEV